MRTTPPGGFTVDYFRRTRASRPKSDTSSYHVFRNTHRVPRALTTEPLWFYVWNGISCTCCTLSSPDKDIHACEDRNEVILEKVREAKGRNEFYDLVFIEYKAERHDEIDKLIRDISKTSPETKVFLLTLRDNQLSKSLRDQGYFAISGDEMIDQATYDLLIAEALGDEGIKALEK